PRPTLEPSSSQTPSRPAGTRSGSFRPSRARSAISGALGASRRPPALTGQTALEPDRAAVVLGGPAPDAVIVERRARQGVLQAVVADLAGVAEGFRLLRDVSVWGEEQGWSRVLARGQFPPVVRRLGHRSTPWRSRLVR